MEFLKLDPLPLVLPEKGSGKRIFVLGADDPEMRRMQQILDESGEDYLFATHEGKRCRPDTAYCADPVKVSEGTTVVLVECEPIKYLGYQGLVRLIDHHREDDPGYLSPASAFWIGSSIGQLYRKLEKGNPTKDDILLAAMDHCMASARKGLCPGVDPEELRAFSLKITCERNGISLSEMEAGIKKMSKEIKSAPVVTIGGQRVTDFTSSPTGIGYSLPYLYTREAIDHLHLAALVSNKNHSQAPLKVMLCGNVTTAALTDFVGNWGTKHGLKELIIAPSRGYALGFRH